ncbi:Zinc binding domain / DNA primase, Phage P4-associated / Replicative helicase RepA, Phage P4-associated [Klebsiella pneumoniae ISC21]|nr:Zinc binding domain / DNA primase, Phage P4-associated / Replicative helicase RepA, Phage P4-associated [Klebsiella pneumoniae ISC21]
MKMNVTDTVKQACGHWPRILPALGMKVIKNRPQACPICGGDARSDRFRFDDQEGAAHGTATGAAPVTA